MHIAPIYFHHNRVPFDVKPCHLWFINLLNLYEVFEGDILYIFIPFPFQPLKKYRICQKASVIDSFWICCICQLPLKGLRLWSCRKMFRVAPGSAGNYCLFLKPRALFLRMRIIYEDCRLEWEADIFWLGENIEFTAGLGMRAYALVLGVTGTNGWNLLILECTHGLKTDANRRKVFEEGSFNQLGTTNFGQNISQDIILESRVRRFHTCQAM